MTLRCFRCDKELDPVFPDMTSAPNQPYAGTRFISYGHYGSTVHDPAGHGGGREFLEINICDLCLLTHKDQVLRAFKSIRTTYEYQAWEPDMTPEAWQEWRAEAQARRLAG